MENYSKQREDILDVLKDSYDHPTAEEIYNRVKQKNSTSSRGTVYRNLKLLVDKNAILKILCGYCGRNRVNGIFQGVARG